MFGWVLGECLGRVKTEKWSGNGFISVQNGPKSTGLENKTWRIRFSGSRGLGGPKKAENDRFWVPGKSHFWPLFGDPIIMSTGSPWEGSSRSTLPISQGLLRCKFLQRSGRLPGSVREGFQGLEGCRGQPGEPSRGLLGACLGAFWADVPGG